MITSQIPLANSNMMFGRILGLLAVHARRSMSGTGKPQNLNLNKLICGPSYSQGGFTAARCLAEGMLEPLSQLPKEAPDQRPDQRGNHRHRRLQVMPCVIEFQRI